LQEPKHFNDFLHHLSNFCREKDLDSFCEFLASKKLTLISKTEAIDRFISLCFFFFFFFLYSFFSLHSFISIIVLLCSHFIWWLISFSFFFFFFSFILSSEVSDAEARSFLVKLEPKTEDLSG
jgi:hypothetical protein